MPFTSPVSGPIYASGTSANPTQNSFAPGGSQNLQQPPPPPQPPGQGPTGQVQAQSPGIFGTGQYFYNPAGINYQGIAGNPGAYNNYGPSTNYGLNDVWGMTQAQENQLGHQGGAMAIAPMGAAAQGAASYGNAGQGAAAFGNAAQWSPAAMLAAQANNVGISTAGDASFQGQQQGLANILQAQAAGYGAPSPADIQLRQGTEGNIASQLAVLGSQRGGMGNPALAARAAADQTAAANAGLNQQLGLQRAQETQAAQQALGNVLGTARGQAQNYNINQAGLLQQTSLANMGARNQVGLANLGYQNEANQGNAQLSQQMGLANLGNAQAMNLANLGYQNQFGLNNVNNAQQMGLANLGNAQQTALANLGLQGQYGLANQQMSLSNAQLYDQELNAILGMQTGLGESNRAANLAAQQLGVQQGLGAAQINEQAYQAAAQANANLATTLFGGGVGAVGQAYNAFSGQNGQTPPGTQAWQQGQGGGSNAAAFPSTDPGSQAWQQGQGAGADPGLVDPNTYEFVQNRPGFTISDRTQKTDVRDGAADVTKALERRRGDMRSSPYADTIRRVHGLLTSSDENLKEGIEGGNPMLDSYLREYHDAMEKEGTVNPTASLGFRAGSSGSAGSGGSSGGGSFGSILGALTGTALAAATGGAALPAIGLGASIGGSVGNAMAPGSSGSGPRAGSAGTGVDVPITQGQDVTEQTDIPEDTDAQTLSDDREKEAVMSGNQGLQAFLEQQGAQTGAQNQQGAYNNAFMSQGGAQQADRQFAPWMMQPGGQSINQGYGEQLGGGAYGGYIDQYGGYGGAGLGSLGGVSSSPGLDAGGVTSMGSPAPVQPAPLPSYAPSAGTSSALSTQATQMLTPEQMQTQNLAKLGGLQLGTRTPPAVNPGSAFAPSAGTSSMLGSAAAQAPLAHAAPGAGTSSMLGSAAAQQPNFGALGGLRLGLSDEDEKTEAAEDPKAIQTMLDHLHAYSYRYKDPGAPGAAPGRRTGVMAQDLEKSPLGSSFVHDTDQGKMVSYGQMAGTQMAALAMLNDKLNDHDRMLRELGSAR